MDMLIQFYERFGEMTTVISEYIPLFYWISDIIFLFLLIHILYILYIVVNYIQETVITIIFKIIWQIISYESKTVNKK